MNEIISQLLLDPVVILEAIALGLSLVVLGKLLAEQLQESNSSNSNLESLFDVGRLVSSHSNR